MAPQRVCLDMARPTLTGRVDPGSGSINTPDEPTKSGPVQAPSRRTGGKIECDHRASGHATNARLRHYGRSRSRGPSSFSRFQISSPDASILICTWVFWKEHLAAKAKHITTQVEIGLGNTDGTRLTVSCVRRRFGSANTGRCGRHRHSQSDGNDGSTHGPRPRTYCLQHHFSLHSIWVGSITRGCCLSLTQTMRPVLRGHMTSRFIRRTRTLRTHRAAPVHAVQTSSSHTWLSSVKVGGDAWPVRRDRPCLIAPGHAPGRFDYVPSMAKSSSAVGVGKAAGRAIPLDARLTRLWSAISPNDGSGTQRPPRERARTFRWWFRKPDVPGGRASRSLVTPCRYSQRRIFPRSTQGRSLVRQQRTPGSAQGVPGNRHSYREHFGRVRWCRRLTLDHARAGSERRPYQRRDCQAKQEVLQRDSVRRNFLTGDTEN